MVRLALCHGAIIQGRRIEPGTLLVRDRRIEAILPPGTPLPEVDRQLDASGMLIAPGFIDAHSHDDVAATDPAVAEAKIRQGVTTVAIGMDGFGSAPVAPPWDRELIRYWTPVNGHPGPFQGASLAALRSRYAGHLALNVVLNVPHANLRILASGFQRRALTPEELSHLIRRVAEGLDQGAAGLTTGLSYVPAAFSDFDELRSALSPLAATSHPYVTHLRDYGIGLFDAVDEALNLARTLDIPVHLSHLHLSHPALFGRAPDLIAKLDQALRQGLRVSWDLYPYSAGSSILHSYLPVWLTEGGPDAALARLRDEKTLTALSTDPQFAGFDWSRVVIASTPSGRAVGASVQELAAQQGQPVAKTVADLLIAEDFSVACVVHQTDPADDDLLAEHPQAMVGSDGLPYGQRPHPRYCGTFPAFFQRYVVERRRLTVAEAIAKMTAQPAALYRLAPQRGTLVPGAAADLVVWDPNHFQTAATYEHPRRMATGVRHVLINGEIVLEGGIFRPEKRPGEVL
ncbi:MAG: amidohydrolase family protein [Firmicutes bacterium]|nr:amidohydrolase family protein [Bacillota bacterium]